MCSEYAESPDSHVLWGDNAKSFGSEVVYLFGGQDGDNVTSVCVPHKVASHSWGKFAQSLTEAADTSSKKRIDFFNSLNFEERLGHVGLKVVVVRHPMERLVSVYRMIFRDWCDQSRFLARQWRGRVCRFETDPKKTNKFLEGGEKPKSVSELFAGMLDEHKHGNDRYMAAIWRKFHPGEELNDPEKQLKFTFPEFVRFLVNGSLEFGPEVTTHRGLSYHWAPYWRECSLPCSKATKPNFVVKMETLESDLESLFEAAKLKSDVPFPHTHTQAGGHSSKTAAEFFSQLTRAEVKQLYDLYRLDHELYGYNIDDYLRLASP